MEGINMQEGDKEVQERTCILGMVYEDGLTIKVRKVPHDELNLLFVQSFADYLSDILLKDERVDGDINVVHEKEVIGKVRGFVFCADDKLEKYLVGRLDDIAK